MGTSKGGLGNEKNRFEANKKAAEILHVTYPKLTKIFQRNSGTCEIKLINSKTLVAF